MRENAVLANLVSSLIGQNKEEQPWLEFKTSFVDDYRLGEYISALSNGAAIEGYPYAYLVFGIHDQTHEPVGTSFKFAKKHIDERGKETGEDLLGWLNHMVSPRIRFDFGEVDFNGKKLIVLEIQSANWQPTEFRKESYFRVGSYVKKLRDYPQRSAELWSALNLLSYEEKMSKEQNLHFTELEKYAKRKKVAFSKGSFITYGFEDRHGFIPIWHIFSATKTKFRSNSPSTVIEAEEISGSKRNLLVRGQQSWKTSWITSICSIMSLS